MKIQYLVAVMTWLITVTAIAQVSGESLFGSIRARQIGPAAMSGRVSCIDVVSSDPSIMYVGSASGGLWKSQSAGASFRPIFDDHTLSIGSITIDQNHPDTIWVGTGETWVRNSVSVGTGLYRSYNGGGNWDFIGLPNSERISRIIIHPTDPQVVWVAVQGALWSANEERGVYKTTDGGESWEKQLYIDENTGAADLSIDINHPDVLFATMWSHRRSPHFFDSGLKFAEAQGMSSVYRSEDGGKTWDKAENGLPDARLGRMAVAVAPSNSDRVYLSVESDKKNTSGLYRSDDGGKNWKLTNREFGMTVRPFYFARLAVDPNNDSLVMKCGLNASISNDAGETFRTIGSGVHSDIHAIWIDPNNSKHIILGTDGGIYESYDGAYLFKMYMNLPISQFYHISVDMDKPYNVYGGLQDNGSWYAPSQKAGGITNSDWKNTYGGDGFYSFRHPNDPDVIYAEYQGGQLVRYNSKTGMAQDIKPYPAEDEDKYRYNWNAPLYQSPNNPERIYFGAQYLFMSENRGDEWKRISPDLSTNDPERQQQRKSGGISTDNSTAENNTTIYTIAESPVNEKIIWAGTDDGNLQVTKNQGKKWRNTIESIPELPSGNWVSFVEPGHYNEDVLYVCFDNHRQGDMNTYVYRTEDLGKTWTRLNTASVEGYALSIREDLENPNLLFLGTEFGLYVSLDRGENWDRFTNNMPKVAVRDMVIHPRDHALVMGTHGRGVIILDDITPLRQVNDENLAKAVHFFETQPTILRDPGAGGGWFGGAGNYVGGNPNTSAQIVYYLAKRHTFGKMYFQVYDADGKMIRELPAEKRAGINIVTMPTSLTKPKAAPTNNRTALFGSTVGPNLAEGTYTVKMIKQKDTLTTSFSLQNDPNSPYSKEDRKVQRNTVLKLYDMSEDIAYFYFESESLGNQLESMAAEHDELSDDLMNLKSRMDTFRNSLVAMGGDFYVDEGEEIRERVSDLYRLVISYPGKPSESQMQRTVSLEREIAERELRFNELTEEGLTGVNEMLTNAGAEPINRKSHDEYVTGAGGSGSGSYQDFKAVYPGTITY